MEALERDGYVTRTPDEVDRRRVYVNPVPERLARVRALRADLGQDWQALLDSHSDEELEVVKARLTLERLSDEYQVTVMAAHSRDIAGATPVPRQAVQPVGPVDDSHRVGPTRNREL